jgi:hypothetical protein
MTWLRIPRPGGAVWRGTARPHEAEEPRAGIRVRSPG